MQKALKALAGLVVAVGFARADLIEFTFRGTVTTIGGAVPAPAEVGDDFEFRYRFHSDAADSEPAPNVGSYAGAITRSWVTIGSYQIVQNVPADIFVLNDGFAGDSYSATAVGPISEAVLSMTNLGGGAFEGDALPTNLMLPQWGLRSLTFHRYVGPSFWSAMADVTGFESRTVPGPGSVVAGVLGLLCLRRRR